MNKTDYENKMLGNITEKFREALKEPERQITKEYIRAKLGLKSFEEMEKDSEENGIYPRRSGRTTEMLLGALERLAKGELVILVSHNYIYSKVLKTKLMEMALNSGITTNPDNIRIMAPSSWEEFRYRVAGINKEAIFIDHYDNMKF